VDGSPAALHLPDDGLVAVVKRDCPTCQLVEPVLAGLSRTAGLTVFSQDDPAFPDGVADRRDDTGLSASIALDIETVPTLVRFAGGVQAAGSSAGAGRSGRS
jgi:hypothetical protein